MKSRLESGFCLDKKFFRKNGSMDRPEYSDPWTQKYRDPRTVRKSRDSRTAQKYRDLRTAQKYKGSRTAQKYMDPRTTQK